MAMITEASAGLPVRVLPAKAAPLSASVLVLLSGGLAGGDFAMMTIALVDAGRQLQVDSASLQWILSASLLTVGGFLMLGGRLVDLVGIRRIFLLGAAFTAAGLLPGVLGTSFALIILGRVLVGLGGAFLNPASFGFIVDQFPAAATRDKAFGLYSAGQSLGFFGGMIGGGFLLALVGWHGAFAVDFLLAAASLLVGMVVLPPSNARGSLKSLDVPGAVAVTIGVGLLVYALSSLGKYGAAAPSVLAAFAGAVVLLIVFAAIERRSRQPLLSFSVFSVGNVGVTVVMALIYNALSIGTFVPAILYMQHVGHVARSTMGLVFIPALLASFLFARLVPIALQRFPARTVAVAGCGFYTLQAIPTLIGNGAHVGPGLAFGCALAAILCSTFGSVTGIITVFTEGTGSAPPDQRGVVSALLLSTSQLGAAVGLAISASTLATHAPGATENFILTSFCVAGGAFASGVLCLAWFRPGA